MLIQQTIPNLIGGVSQIPPALRQANQGEICDNAFPSPVDGLTKRPPSQFLAALWNYNTTPGGDPQTNDAFVHWINRDGVERYVVVLANGVWHIHDLTTGAAYPVVYQVPGDSAYFVSASGSPRKDFRGLTIGDTTYVVNKNVAVAMDPASAFTPTVAAPNTAIIWIKTASNSATYTININNALAATTTAAASGAVGTDTIASALVTALSTANYNFANGWNVSRNGSYIAINRLDNGFFPVEALDSLGGTAIGIIQNGTSVNLFSDLPHYASQGMVMTVAGDLSSSNAARYYVQFLQNTYTVSGPNLFPGPGVWTECAASGVLQSLDPTTMPKSLVRKVDDNIGTVTGIPNQIYFHVERPAWGTRSCGDLTTNPNPSFVGATLNDIFLYQNRLGFLTDTKVLLSQSGSLTNFFRITALQLQDNDRIDITATHPRVVKLRHAVPWQQQMVLFGDLAQFVLTTVNNAAVSPNTVSLVSTTEYDTDITVRPIPVQNLLYFPFNRHGYVGMREYYVEYYTQKHVGKEVTDVCPNYMAGTPARLANGLSSDLLAVVLSQTNGGDAQGSIYIYKWQWQGNTLYSADKLQSAWVRWNFPGSWVLGVQIYAQQMYVLLQRTDTTGDNYYVSLEVLNCDSTSTDLRIDAPAGTPATPYTIYLDRRCDETQCTGIAYDPVAKTTSFNAPVKYNPQTAVVVQRPLFPTDTEAGGISPVVSVVGNLVTVSGTLTNFFIGESYTMQFRFSPLIIRQQQPSGQPVGVINGKTQVRTITVKAMDSGYFRLEITPYYRTKSTVVYTGNQIGQSLTPIGSFPGQTESQQLRALVGANNNEVTIDLINDSHLPSRFSNAEWEAMYYTRAKQA